MALFWFYRHFLIFNSQFSILNFPWGKVFEGYTVYIIEGISQKCSDYYYDNEKAFHDTSFSVAFHCHA